MFSLRVPDRHRERLERHRCSLAKPHFDLAKGQFDCVQVSNTSLVTDPATSKLGNIPSKPIADKSERFTPWFRFRIPERARTDGGQSILPTKPELGTRLIKEDQPCRIEPGE